MSELLDILKENGYSTYRLRKERVLGESSITRLRNGEDVSVETLEKIRDITGLPMPLLMAGESAVAAWRRKDDFDIASINLALETPLDDLSPEDERYVSGYIAHVLEGEALYRVRGGLYQWTQINMAYNSNRIEGSKLSEEQTASLFETSAVPAGEGETVISTDIEEATGHFAMFNHAMKTLGTPLSEEMIKTFHKRLKEGVYNDYINGYAVGDYKRRANIVGGIKTTPPARVPDDMKELLSWYDPIDRGHDMLGIAAFHRRYEKIHPFQDGNGRTGRMILFRECLVNGRVPVIIRDADKSEYYKALGGGEEDLADFIRRERDAYWDICGEILFTLEREQERER